MKPVTSDSNLSWSKRNLPFVGFVLVFSSLFCSRQSPCQCNEMTSSCWTRHPVQQQHTEEWRSSHWGALLLSHQESLHGSGARERFISLCKPPKHKYFSLYIIACACITVKRDFFGFLLRMQNFCSKKLKRAFFLKKISCTLFISGELADLHHVGC